MTISVDSVQLAQIETLRTEGVAQDKGADFRAALSAEMKNVQGAINEADSLLRSYAAGGDVAVHDLMIAMEKARFSMQLAVEVRNRVVESYQEFMRMQL